MSLKKYKAKRDFAKTPEPLRSLPPFSDSPRFVIQKHAARRLHYDFRLEYKGVLLSWAVPKGPSLDPKDKRLAIKVEDHPLDYQYFEGIIPQGNYGAGTVEIWDKGTFHTYEARSKKDIEKTLQEGLKKGHFNIILEGERLRGEFVFQKLNHEDESWLLFKKKDAFASEVASIDTKKKVRKKLPDFIPPMLATLVDKPFDNEDWLFEIKYDGFRALAFIETKRVQLYSRTQHSWNLHFPLIVDELKKISVDVILDGEIVVLDEKGRSCFQLIQNYQRNQGNLCYFVFDLLFFDGQDLRNQPLIERKTILQKLLNDMTLSHVRFSDHLLCKGKDFFTEALKNQLEGIIGKKLISTYQSKRSSEWVKIKGVLRQEVVIGGFTAPRGSREKLGALLVGIYQKKEFVYVGHVGGGFNKDFLNTVYQQLQPLIQSKCPFKKEPHANEKVTWVNPKLICEVSFSEWTKDNLMRQPIFQGIREDKQPKTIVKEVPKKMEFSHADKIYWPEEGYTKGDLLNYYEKIASYILPYLKNRPITLHRYPEGIEGLEFYQKDLPSGRPEWIKTCEIQQEKKLNHYLIINDVKSLLYAVNLGSIDIHPLISRCNHIDQPDYTVIDIDPHDISFDKVIEAALLYHELLEKIKVPHFCKTSGGKGLHIFIPLKGKYDFDQSKHFAELISTIVYQKLPNTTSLERASKKREKKIYLDCLQNRNGQTIVAPYSVRPRPHALVSAPLSWKEVDINLNPKHFDMFTVPLRLEKMGDLFLPILKQGINLEKALKDISKIIEK